VTSICHDQIRLLEENHLHFDEWNTVLRWGWGVEFSCPSNTRRGRNRWISRIRDCYSDFWPHGEIALKYGVFRENDGFPREANIIIDEGQTVFLLKSIPHLNCLFRGNHSNFWQNENYKIPATNNCWNLRLDIWILKWGCFIGGNFGGDKVSIGRTERTFELAFSLRLGVFLRKSALAFKVI